MKQLALNEPEQIDAYENAEQAVQADYAKGNVDGDPWGARLPAGEVVRILAQAYVGELDTADEYLDTIDELPLEPDVAGE